MTIDEVRAEIDALRIVAEECVLAVRHAPAVMRLLDRHEALLARMTSGVEVRIGVSVDAKGLWLASGAPSASERQTQNDCGHGVDDRFTYVTAWVPKPEPVKVETVEGLVR